MVFFRICEPAAELAYETCFEVLFLLLLNPIVQGWRDVDGRLEIAVSDAVKLCKIQCCFDFVELKMVAKKNPMERKIQNSLRKKYSFDCLN